MDTKRCGKCEEVKSVDGFHKDKSRPDGLQVYCKICLKKYHEDNKEADNARCRLYSNNNRDAINRNTQKWRLNNKDKMLEHARNHYNKHKFKPCKILSLFKQLPITDKPKLDSEGYITVVCKMCGERYRPHTLSIKSRVDCLRGNMAGESNFYCQDVCRDACPLHGFKSNNTDPRSKLAISKTDQQIARDCQTDHLKILQIDEFGYNFCEKCGTKVDTVELHHTLEIAKFGLEAINSAGHLLVCNECHKEFTKDCNI